MRDETTPKRKPRSGRADFPSGTGGTNRGRQTEHNHDCDLYFALTRTNMVVVSDLWRHGSSLRRSNVVPQADEFTGRSDFGLLPDLGKCLRLLPFSMGSWFPLI
jgi:hypothetical protein